MPLMLPSRSAFLPIFTPLTRISRLFSKMSASIRTLPKRLSASARMNASSSPARMSCFSFRARGDVPVQR